MVKEGSPFLGFARKKIGYVDPFSVDVLKIISGTTIAQIITIISSPIITRIYGPEIFGIFTLFMSIVSILAVLSCLRYENAILLPKSDDEAINLVGLCLIIVFLISGILMIVCNIFSQQIISLLNAPSLSEYLWLLPLFVLINGIFLTFNYWNTRMKKFGRLSITKVAGSVTTNGIQMGFGFTGFISGFSLIFGSIFGQIVSTLVLGWKIYSEDLLEFKNKIEFSLLIAGFKRYSNFPIYDLWGALLNTISSQLPIILLALFFSTTIVGYYSLGVMVLLFPTTLIGGAIAQVFFQRASESKNIDRTLVKELVEKTISKLLIIGVLPFLIILLYGQELFSIIFGSAWSTAGLFAQILAVWFFLAFIASPISTLFIVFEKQKFSLFINIITFTFRFIAIIIGGILDNYLVSIILFSLVGIISNGGSLVWLASKAEASFYLILGSLSAYIYYVIFFSGSTDRF